jgi:hypothetical protein
MNRILMIGMVVMAALFVGPGLQWAVVVAGDNEVEVQLSEVPAAVQKAFTEISGVESASKIEREEHEGAVRYEFDYDVDGGSASVTFTDKGETLEIENQVGVEALPEAVLREVMKDYPGATISKAEAVQVFYYELKVTVDGKTREIVVLATGDIEDDDDDDDDDHHDEDHDDEDDGEDDDD